MNLICITDAVKLFGVSSKTLRFYESVGLLHPIRNDDNKYRYYDAAAIERIRQILILRKMQIPVKDIVRIYENEDMSTVVKVFVNRIDEIEEEISALTELKQIVNEFLQAMMKSGITKISALPLLYEEMDKHLDAINKQNQQNSHYQKLSEISDRLTREPGIRILELPEMRMLTSIRTDSGQSDVDYYNDWNLLHNHKKLSGIHSGFEYQNRLNETVVLRMMSANDINNSPFTEIYFEGGLFAACALYVDEDIGSYLRKVISHFESNSYYQIDYKNNGELRHEILIETILSDDEQRERIELLVPIRKRLPNHALFNNGSTVENVSLDEINQSNPILWSEDYALSSEIRHINSPKLSIPTGINVRYPFRVDLAFRMGRDIISQYDGAGRGIPEIIIRYGKEDFTIYNSSCEDLTVLSKGIKFHQPVLGNICHIPIKQIFDPHAVNHLTWIIGAKHFAFAINDEIQYCSIDNPYMKMDLMNMPEQEIIIDTGQGIFKTYFSQIRVSQLKIPYKTNIKKGR